MQPQFVSPRHGRILQVVPEATMKFNMMRWGRHVACAHVYTQYAQSMHFCVRVSHNDAPNANVSNSLRALTDSSVEAHDPSQLALRLQLILSSRRFPFSVLFS